MNHKLKCTTPLKSSLISNYQHLTQLYHQTYQVRKNTRSHDKQLLTYTTVASTSNHMVRLTKWAKGATALAGNIISITTVVSSKLILKIYNLTGLYFVDITTVCSTSQTNITVPTLQYSLQLTRLKTRIVSLIYQSTQTRQPKNSLVNGYHNCYWNIIIITCLGQAHLPKELRLTT